jgi:non-ribosomal peptide synthetase component E (peptide arylation enzyme)
MSDLLQRTATPYDERIYPEDWRLWRDPEVPEWLDPAGWLLDRHGDTPIADKPALICDGEMVTYAQLRERVARYAEALAVLGLAPESRLLA